MGRIAVISDIHGNSPALKAVLADISRQKCTRLFVLGDIINGVDPHGCLELLRAWDDLICIKGNAEFYVMSPIPEPIYGEKLSFHFYLVNLVQWIRSRLTKADLEWLQSLPDYITWNKACFVHDSPLDRLFPERWHKAGIPIEYQEWFYHSPGISPDMTESEWKKLSDFMERYNLTHVFCGHSHVPFQRSIGERQVCNVGSVGLPLDGDPRPSWVLLEGEPGRDYHIVPMRIDYDLEQALQQVDEATDYPDFQSAGMKAAYQQTLKTGVIWKKPVP